MSNLSPLTLELRDADGKPYVMGVNIRQTRNKYSYVDIWINHVNGGQRISVCVSKEDLEGLLKIRTAELHEL